jgi:hypothetical protein
VIVEAGAAMPLGVDAAAARLTFTESDKPAGCPWNV